MSKTFSKFALTASLVLAMAFTFSCSGDDGNGEEKFSYCIKEGSCYEGPYTLEGCSSFGGMPSNNCPNGGGGGSSSSGGGQGGGSSSSGGGSPSSSSVGGNGDDGSVVHEGQTYRTVKIGTQTWFAENLNYAAAGSKCYGEGSPVLIDYDDENDIPITKILSETEVQANCVKYGRLYDWATAMGFPSSCNENSCLSQIQSKHKGICPSGWHIPSNADWDKLLLYVDNENDGEGEVDDHYYNSYYSSWTAGRYLKATSGWEPYEGIENFDTYGFSALPGGYGNIGGYGNVGIYFLAVGSYGRWWSASEEDLEGHIQRMRNDREYVAGGTHGKSYLLSVRCVKD